MENKENKEKRIRKLTGIVTSDKMDKTIVVSVTSFKEHPLYHKRYKVTKKYKANDAQNQHKKGDEVVIYETKPFSRTKRWEVKPESGKAEQKANAEKEQNKETKND